MFTSFEARSKGIALRRPDAAFGIETFLTQPRRDAKHNRVHILGKAETELYRNKPQMNVN